MPTTGQGYPYPAGTDRLVDGDNVIAALAQAVNDKLGACAAGTASVPITAVETATSVAVTFPVGRFTAPPHVNVCANTGSPGGIYNPCSAGATTGGVTLWGARNTGTTAFNVNWIAVQH